MAEQTITILVESKTATRVQGFSTGSAQLVNAGFTVGPAYLNYFEIGANGDYVYIALGSSSSEENVLQVGQDFNSEFEENGTLTFTGGGISAVLDNLDDDMTEPYSIQNPSNAADFGALYDELSVGDTLSITLSLTIIINRVIGDMWLCGSSPDNVHLSQDDGVTWGYSVSAPSEQLGMSGIAFHPITNDLWACGFDPDFIYSSQDDGVTWGLPINGPSGQTGITDIEFDPVTGYLWLCGTSPDSVYFSQDDGVTWSAPINGPSGQTLISGIAFHPITNDLWLCGTTPDSVYFSQDDGASWFFADSGPSGQTLLYGIAFHPITNDLWACGSTPDGVYSSQDDGVTWGPRINGPLGQTSILGIRFYNGGTPPETPEAPTSTVLGPTSIRWDWMGGT